MTKPIEIRVRLDARAFRRFCAFDTFRRQRRWFAPLMTGMVLVTLAVGGLLDMIPIGESASGVLMGLGIAVPMAVFGLYVIQIEANIAAQHLKDAPEVYALRLTGEGLRITNSRKPEEPPVELPWDRLMAAFRRRDGVYLYAAPERAFILPNGQADAADEAVWRCIKKNMGEGKCVETR